MNIGQAARRSGLTAKTIRYYEEVGLVVPLRQKNNDYRDYSEADVEQLVFLQRARAAGFSIDECRELLELFRDPERQAAHVKQLVVQKMRQLDKQLQVLQNMRETLAGLADRCAGDETADCVIIESLAGYEVSEGKPLMPFTLVESHEDS